MTKQNHPTGSKSERIESGTAAAVTEVAKTAGNSKSETGRPGTPDVNSKELTQEEKTALKAREHTIGRCLRGGWELAEALAEIDTRHLYRGKFKTFQHYCQKRWRLSYRRVRQLIDAWQVRMRLVGVVDEKRLPETECQVRSLVLLKDAELQAKVWKQVSDEAGGQPTGGQVTKAVKAFLPKPTRPQVDEVRALVRSLERFRNDVAGENPELDGVLDVALDCVNAVLAKREGSGKTEPVSPDSSGSKTGKVTSPESVASKEGRTEGQKAA